MRRFLVVAIVLLASSVYAQDIQARFVGHMWEGQINAGFGANNHLFQFVKDGAAIVFTDTSLTANTDDVKKYSLKPGTGKLPAYLDKDKGLAVVYTPGQPLYFSVLGDGSLLSSDGRVFKAVTALPDWDVVQ